MTNKKQFKEIARNCQDPSTIKLSEERIEEAIRIRLVENKFLELFSQGLMNGTVHTCVGQEFSAVIVAGQLGEDDWVTSNHRCHGHFISKTKNWRGLIDELMGLETGVCRGLGSSQHLYSKGFMSNGPQAALVPVATGIALYKKISKEEGITVSFIGEGTLGEGVLYESFNLASLYHVPQLFVCENNLYSQSTPQDQGVAGSIAMRPAAFGIKVFEADTWDVDNLNETAKEAISYVRAGNPAFLIIKTYRLNAHSKGDDNRDVEELEYFKKWDMLNRLLEVKKWEKVSESISEEINQHINTVNKETINYDSYVFDQLPRRVTARTELIENEKKRMVQALNQGYDESIARGAFHIGEDILDPYGGAFKVTKGFSTKHPKSVFGASISESGLVGLALGMSLMGKQSFAEIMFGDFMTHTFDQIISNASKFHHMYAFQVSAPLRIRTPMGGKRGYGPTHSQSLEKYMLGIDNVGVVSFSSLLDPMIVIKEMENIPCPLILLENKVDYGRYLYNCPEGFKLRREAKTFGAILLSPCFASPTLTIVSYGETARHIADNLERLFVETDYIPELVCITQLHPLDVNLIERSLKITGNLLCVEDGSINFGFGGEVIASLLEKRVAIDRVMRIGADPVPIPSVSKLELEVLPTIERIIKKINENIRSMQ